MNAEEAKALLKDRGISTLRLMAKVAIAVKSS
jgi:hypothetical protein